MTGAEAREEFRVTSAAMVAARRRRHDQSKAIEVQQEEELEAAAVAHRKAIGKKRGKKSARSVLPVEVIDRVHAEYQGRFNRAWDLTSAEMRGLEARLRALAPEAEIRRGEPRTVYIGDPYTYSGQTDATGYAQSAAECRAAELKAEGFETKIERVDSILGGETATGGAARGYGDFIRARRKTVWHVRVPLAEDLDVEILKKRPPLPVKEQVRNLLRHGLNPWVLDPFLPRDIMEKLGLDWQGRDVSPAAVAPAATEATHPRQHP